jgi:hypothetical protein
LPTIQGIREHRDELMEAAMKCQSENDVFKLYPNPTSDHLHYELSPNNPFKFEIYDIMGRKCISESASSGVIDISSLKNGIYIFKIFSNNQILTKKIIKY